MNDRILDIINQIRANKGVAKLDTIDSTTRLREDIEFDSFDLAELTVNIEEQFAVDIFEDGVISTVGELCKKLEQK